MAYTNDRCAKCGIGLRSELQSHWYRAGCECMFCNVCAPEDSPIPIVPGTKTYVEIESDEPDDGPCFFCGLVGLIFSGRTRAEIDEYVARFPRASIGRPQRKEEEEEEVWELSE